MGLTRECGFDSQRLDLFFFTTVSFVAVGRILSLLSDELEVKPAGKVSGGVKQPTCMSTKIRMRGAMPPS
jgi:hypothetical protein